jgi:hypothetical protein
MVRDKWSCGPQVIDNKVDVSTAMSQAAAAGHAGAVLSDLLSVRVFHKVVCICLRAGSAAPAVTKKLHSIRLIGIDFTGPCHE